MGFFCLEVSLVYITQTNKHTHTHTCMHIIYIYIYTHVCMCVCNHLYIYIYIYIYIYVYIHTHMHACIPTYVHTCVPGCSPCWFVCLGFCQEGSIERCRSRGLNRSRCSLSPDPNPQNPHPKGQCTQRPQSIQIGTTLRPKYLLFRYMDP